MSCLSHAGNIRLSLLLAGHVRERFYLGRAVELKPRVMHSEA